jgi:hypothetical protein
MMNATFDVASSVVCRHQGKNVSVQELDKEEEVDEAKKARVKAKRMAKKEGKKATKRKEACFQLLIFCLHVQGLCRDF